MSFSRWQFILIGFLVGKQLIAREIVWAPILDQRLQAILEIHNQVHLNHQSFSQASNRPVGPQAGGHYCAFPDSWNDLVNSADRTTSKIDAALASAWSKGVRVIDFEYILSNTLEEKPPRLWPSNISYYDAVAYHSSHFTLGTSASGGVASMPTSTPVWRAWSNASRGWLDRIVTHNTSTGNHFKVRLRLTATAPNLFDAYYRGTSSYSSAVRSLPTTLADTRARRQNGAGDPGIEVPDLSNPAIPYHIGRWAIAVINDVKASSNSIVIESVSLNLEDTNESGIWDDSFNEVITFPGQGPFPASSTMRWRIHYYLNREKLLVNTWKSFSDAVKTVANHNSTAILPSVFFQTWVFDGWKRGVFDLYSALKTSGVGFLHHTQWPNTDSLANQRQVAFSASIASRLGIDFDTEFSWAHFNQNNPQNMEWAASNRTDGNANSFKSQAVAGFRYGSTGYTYANWFMHDIQTPPNSSAWNWVNQSTSRDSLLAISGLSAAQNAIYISTIGRIHCEENSRLASADTACTHADYLSWFTEFGLTGKVDIITDGMIHDNPNLFNAYSSICIPFETSFYTDNRVLLKIKALSSTIKANFRYQPSKTATGGNINSGVTQWLANTNHFTSASIVNIPIRSILLD